MDPIRPTLTLLIGIIGLILLLLYWATGGVQSPETSPGAIAFTPSSFPRIKNHVKKLKIISWNIAYGYGIGSDNNSYRPRDKDEYTAKLNSIAELIRKEDADIVLLQEVDFASNRSNDIDELHFLSEKTGLSYRAEAVSWVAGYVPFPYLPINAHFGKMVSGGGVLSRYPILKNEVVLHPKPNANAWWYNAFYLFRYSQKVLLDLDGKPSWVINNHLEAYDIKNREEQAVALVNLETQLHDQDEVLLVGGDFNTVHSSSPQKSGFADTPNDSYEGDKTLEILDEGFSSLQEVVSDENFSKNPSEYYTFPSTSPNRRLDYLWINQDYKLEDLSIPKTGDLSDHLPLIVTLKSSS